MSLEKTPEQEERDGLDLKDAQDLTKGVWMFEKSISGGGARNNKDIVFEKSERYVFDFIVIDVSSEGCKYEYSNPSDLNQGHYIHPLNGSNGKYSYLSTWSEVLDSTNLVIINKKNPKEKIVVIGEDQFKPFNEEIDTIQKEVLEQEEEIRKNLSESDWVKLRGVIDESKLKHYTNEAMAKRIADKITEIIVRKREAAIEEEAGDRTTTLWCVTGNSNFFGEKAFELPKGKAPDIHDYYTSPISHGGLYHSYDGGKTWRDEGGRPVTGSWLGVIEDIVKDGVEK
jgi:hypothetical protein